MIFYLAIETSGRKVLSGTQVDAKKLDKNFTQVDIPVDKKGLMEFIQESLDLVHDLEGRINSAAHDASIAPVTIPVSTDQEEHDLTEPNPAPTRFSDKFDNSRDNDRAEVMGVSRDVLNMSDKILTMDGWPLGQIAASVTSRIAELSKPYVEADPPAEVDSDYGAESDEE